MKYLYAGGPCSCRPGRYVRYVIPSMPGVPTSIVSCRGNDAGKGDLVEHPIPTGTEVLVRVPTQLPGATA